MTNVFSPDSPEHLVATEECQVQSLITSCLNMLSLVSGPILIVTHGQEQLVTEQLLRNIPDIEQ